MEWLDSILNAGKEAFGWLDDHSDSIGKVFDTGRKIYNAYDASSTRQQSRSDIASVYQKLMDQEMAYANDYRAWQEGQLAAQNANAAARASAAAATDRNRQAAAKKALAVQKKMLKQLQEGYAPYVEASRAITPKATQNYMQYLDSTSLLNQYLTPTVMKGFAEPMKPSSSYALLTPPVQLSQPSSGVNTQQLIEQILKGK